MARVRLDELWLEDSDDKLYRRVSGGFREVSPSAAGGEGAVNYAKNPLEEDSLSQLTYSGVTPAWSTTHNLFGGGALRCNMTSSGTGRYLRIALDDLSDAQITEMLRLSFFYKLVTGGDDAVRLSIWDGTNHTYLTPEYLIAASGSITKYDGWCFSISKTSHYLQFTFKDSTAIDFYVAAVSFVPRVLPQGAVISEWRSYTPTFQGFGTPTTVDCKWRRVGSSMEIRANFTQSTSSAVEARVSLPSPFVSSSLITVMESCGLLHRTPATDTNTVAVAVQPSKDYVVFLFDTSAFTAANGGSYFNGKVTFHASVPIEGWTSSINLVTEAQEFAFNTQATINTNDTTSFGYGPNGTPILANTAITYYDVQFKNPVPNSLDKFALEVRSKVDGSWVDIEDAFVPSLYCVLGQTIQGYDSANWFWRGAKASKVSANKVRVYFFTGCWGSVDFTDGADVSIKSWAQIVAASDGYDRWRVRKISNGNMAEAPASGIYESGQNANGYYVKYIDGTMEQWGSWILATAVQAVSFPIAFADTNYSVSAIPEVSAAARALTIYSKLTTGCTASQFNTTNGAGVAGTVGWLAIGKWNLSRSVAAPGTPVGASTVYASVAMANSGSVTASNPVPFITVWEDSLSTITLATGRFTAPVAGIYMFSANCSQSTATQTFSFWRNGTASTGFGSTNANWNGSGSAILRLSAGDYVDVRPNNTVTMTGGTFMVARLSA